MYGYVYIYVYIYTYTHRPLCFSDGPTRTMKITHLDCFYTLHH